MHAKAGSFLIHYNLLKNIQLQRFIKRKRKPPGIKQAIKKGTFGCLFITAMPAQKNHVHVPGLVTAIVPVLRMHPSYFTLTHIL